MEKLWGGRFQGKSEAWIDDFGASISFDQKMAKEDLTGSLAHVAMLGKCGSFLIQKQQKLQPD